MASQLFNSLATETALIARTYLNFAVRPLGNYTSRQLSAGAAYTLFCHAEIETFFETWAKTLLDLALTRWGAGTVSRPLLHVCTFHGGRNELSSVPSKDIWSELVVNSIRKQQAIVSNNNGIREANICRLLAPLGFDVRKLDGLLLNDLAAFSTIRGGHAHLTHSAQLLTVLDPFDRKKKVDSLIQLLEVLDTDLMACQAAA